MTTKIRFVVTRAATFAIPLLAAWSCSVEDKGDYTFTDNPGTGGDAGSGGSAARGGGAGSPSAGGNGGNGNSGRGGASGTGGAGDSGGEAGAPSGGSSFTAGEGGRGGEGGESAAAGRDSGGSGGDAGSGGAGGGPCASEPCEHGVCAEDGDDYQCDCTGTGYTGSRCQTNIDDCAGDPCANGGECTDAVNAFACDCSGTGFTGPTCEVPETTTCASRPCQRGTCTDAAGGFTCDCGGTGYTGRLCETDIDDCASNPCFNGGRCTDDGPNAYTCDCTGTGYTGSKCEILIDPCATNPCLHGGTCRSSGTEFTCDCAGTSYTGRVCEVCQSGALLLGDDVGVGPSTAAELARLEAELSAIGLTVTRLDRGVVDYDGSTPASNFGVVIMTPGLAYATDMNAAGQQSIWDAVMRDRTGLVMTEWVAYNHTNYAAYATLSPLILASYISFTSGNFAYSLLAAGHPIWDGLPSTFTTTGYIGGAVLVPANGGTPIATCTSCGGPGVLTRDSAGTSGRIVHISHGANYGNQAWLDDRHLARMFTNAAKWATDCL